MSDLATIRADLVAALEVVLPGRVFAHPPTSGRYVAPAIYVEQATIAGDMDGPVATFPVWVMVDGAVESQIAAHDGIVWNAWLALWPMSSLIVARPQPLAGLRATVLEADVAVDVYGLCGPPPPVAYTYTR